MQQARSTLSRFLENGRRPRIVPFGVGPLDERSTPPAGRCVASIDRYRIGNGFRACLRRDSCGSRSTSGWHASPGWA